jgi:hypothetical protein
MEHYYVVTGNEYGLNPGSKKNYKPSDLDKARQYYESVLEDDFYAGLIRVDEEGRESVVDQKIDE